MKRLFSPPWSGSCVSHHFRELSIQMFSWWKSHSSLYAYSTSAALLICPKWICLEIVSSPCSICTLHQLPLKKQNKKKKKSWWTEFVWWVCSASIPATALAWGCMFSSSPSACPILVNVISQGSSWTHAWTIQKFVVRGWWSLSLN